MASISPFDAICEVTFAPDCRSARANRFGIGFGQRGFAGNVHYPTLEDAEAAWEERLVELRRIYGTPTKGWTGRYIEEPLPIAPGSGVLRRVRFVPLLKSGKHGKAIHSLYLYPIDVKDERLAALRDALKIPVG